MDSSVYTYVGSVNQNLVFLFNHYHILQTDEVLPRFAASVGKHDCSSHCPCAPFSNFPEIHSWNRHRPRLATTHSATVVLTRRSVTPRNAPWIALHSVGRIFAPPTGLYGTLVHLFVLFGNHSDLSGSQLVDELPVECPSRGQGCTATPQRSLVNIHVRDHCPHATVPCPEPKCGTTVLRKDLEAHRKTCGRRPIICVACHQGVDPESAEVRFGDIECTYSS